MRVAIDHETGDYETFRQWEVVEDNPDPLEFPTRQIYLADALAKETAIEVGDFIEEPMNSVEFGRIAAQSAKHGDYAEGARGPNVNRFSMRTSTGSARWSSACEEGERGMSSWTWEVMRKGSYPGMK